MKKQPKLMLTLAAFVAFFCLAGVFWYFVAKGESYKPNPIRPKDFPEILIAPEHATLIDHSTPSNSRRVPHTYDLCFLVNDPYPSDDTYRFIEEHLSLNGWQRLKYDLLNPHSSHSQPTTLPKYLDPETVNMLIPKGKQKGDYPINWREEDWVNKDDEHISVFLYYSADLATKEVHRDKIYVNMTLFGRESWIRTYILKYKKLHPEEFSKDAEPEQDN
jgi:hypothetical protein